MEKSYQVKVTGVVAGIAAGETIPLISEKGLKKVKEKKRKPVPEYEE